jgi:hypothetical protein
VSVDEWRVEVDLDDEQHGYDLGERLRSQRLDDDARQRLGRRVIVTRDGPRLFLYAASEEPARVAEQVVRELVAAEGFSAEIVVTRWHPGEQAWKDGSIPLPRTEAEVREEILNLEEAERREAAEEGSFDWWVKVELQDRGDAADLAQRLKVEGLRVHRLWRYLTIEVLTADKANEIADRLRDELPGDAEVWVAPNLDDVPGAAFVFMNSPF